MVQKEAVNAVSIVQLLQKDNAASHYWSANEQVLVACSGGVDSMALLHALQQLPVEDRPDITVLHVHHHLREAAEADYQLVRAYCWEHHLNLEVKHWENPPDTNVEAAARKFRYDFFKEQMAATGSTTVLTAHHADDQIETILMRLTRGSTLKGYAGIQTTRSFGMGTLIRPLLTVEKDTLYAYCAAHAVPFREDETNQMLGYTRNRYRQQVVPLIKKENKQAAQHFTDFSKDLTDLVTIVEPLIQENCQRVFTQKGKEWELDRDAFLKYSDAMKRLVMSHFLTNVWQVAVQRQHVHDIIALTTNEKPQSEINLADGTVQRRYAVIRFLLPQAAKLKKLQFKEDLSLNKWLVLPFNGKIGLFLPSKQECESEPNMYVRKEEVTLPLIVRNWQPGDTIQMNHKKTFTKKISRIFIDKKIPVEEREAAWVVTDQQGKILLVPGYASSIWVHESGDFVLSLININEVQDVTSRY